jgi:Tfp pilus assembly protein PilX
MKTNARNSERGQALVLIVLALVGLLGFTALAVDGSMVYADRRFAQNAADASALSGGAAAAMEIEKSGVNYNNWPCTAASLANGTIPSSLGTAASKARAATSNSAKENGFVLATNETKSTVVSNRHGIYLNCGLEGSGYFKDKFLEVHSLVTRQTNTSFVHFVFNGPMINSVEAVARVRPRQNLAYGYAIVALNPADCSGSKKIGAGFHGDATTIVDGGGIWSNGCLYDSANTPMQVKDAGVYYCTENKVDGTSFIFTPSNSPTQTGSPCVQIPPEAYTIDGPNCADPAAHNVTAAQFESAAKVSNGGLSAGLWCVTGAVKFNATAKVAGHDVTIVFFDDLTVNGGADVDFTAPNSPDPKPAVTGLVFYFPPSNDAAITIDGGGDLNIVGTILAPTSEISIQGTSDTDALHTQVIAWNVDMGGNAGTFVLYEDNQQMQVPTRMDLWR